MGRVRRVLSGPSAIGVLVVGLAVVGAGLFWFEPWQLLVNETVREEPPAAAVSTPVGSPARASASPEPETLAVGRLISHEHETSGSVRILRLPDGALTLRLDDLDTSNGPDLRVWLTDAPVKPGRDGWHVFDDGAHVSLGELKGNKGDQNYSLPAGIDLGKYTSVSIWCDRFNVSFGAAALDRS